MCGAGVFTRAGSCLNAAEPRIGWGKRLAGVVLVAGILLGVGLIL